MQRVEGTVRALVLPGFEGTVAAYHAVQDAEDNKLPFTQQLDGALPTSLALVGEIHRLVHGSDPDRNPELEGRDAAVTIQSLEAIATDESQSPYRATARWVLAEAAKSEKQTRSPTVVNGEVIPGHAVLNGFRRFVTERRPAKAFPVRRKAIQA